MNKSEKIKLLQGIQSGAISPDALLFADKKPFIVFEDRYFYAATSKEYLKTDAEVLIKRYKIPVYEVESYDFAMKLCKDFDILSQ